MAGPDIAHPNPDLLPFAPDIHLQGPAAHPRIMNPFECVAAIGHVTIPATDARKRIGGSAPFLLRVLQELTLYPLAPIRKLVTRGAERGVFEQGQGLHSAMGRNRLEGGAMTAMASNVAGHAIDPVQWPYRAGVGIEKQVLLLTPRGMTVQTGNLGLPIECRELSQHPPAGGTGMQRGGPLTELLDVAQATGRRGKVLGRLGIVIGCATLRRDRERPIVSGCESGGEEGSADQTGEYSQCLPKLGEGSWRSVLLGSVLNYW